MADNIVKMQVVVDAGQSSSALKTALDEIFTEPASKLSYLVAAGSAGPTVLSPARDSGTLKYTVLKNLDDTNSVTAIVGGTDDFMVDPGEMIIVPGGMGGADALMTAGPVVWVEVVQILGS